MIYTEASVIFKSAKMPKFPIYNITYANWETPAIAESLSLSTCWALKRMLVGDIRENSKAYCQSIRRSICVVRKVCDYLILL
jgi:hypothetical protein